jgi:acrylyl-CoA reductase (NADPH)
MAKLDAITTEIGLSEVVDFAPRFMDGQVRGRTVVDTSR